MRRSDFFKTLFGVPAVALGLSKQEIIEIPASLTHCKDCDTKLFNGKCLNTKYCNECKAWKHFPEERCESCGNGYIPYSGNVWNTCYSGGMMSGMLSYSPNVTEQLEQNVAVTRAGFGNNKLRRL